MKRIKNKRNIMKKISLSQMLTGIVVMIVLVLTVTFFFAFVNIYKNTTEENVVTSSEQAVLQVKNTVENYTEDMEILMEMIQKNISRGKENTDTYLKNLISIRKDIVAITTHDVIDFICNHFINITDTYNFPLAIIKRPYRINCIFLNMRTVL
jgi:two-component system, sensor histidine kinase YesM